MYDKAHNDFIEGNEQNRCLSQAYDVHTSDSSKILSRTSSKLSYGSADLQGFIWEDETCLQPSAGKQSAAQMKQSKCSPF
mmetsp:Transcript_31162/g.47665  ORF Transcript_31162/g.47665 Transcript_31162/m.47665 type:complete len:80 (-) Transcript_31162:777-1016(-)